MKTTGGAQTDQKPGEMGEEGDLEGQRAKAQAQGIPPNAYNSMDYANLNVSTEISELFQYISRYHARNIELSTKFRPFIPEYISAVGEVDAFLKVPRPDGTEETLGLVSLVLILLINFIG